MNKPLIGFAYFESGINLSGLASVNGEDAKHFSSIEDLMSQFPSVIFITSLSEFEIKCGLIENASWLKSNSFFLTSTNELGLEVGLSLDNLSHYVVEISKILSLVVLTASRYVDINLDFFTFMECLSSCAQVNEAKKNALEISTSMRRLMINGRDEIQAHVDGVRLSFNRAVVFEKMMETPIPSGDWKEVTANAGELKNSEILNSTKSIIVLISISKISKIEAEFNQVLNKQLNLSTLSWVTLSELQIISQFCNFKIHRLFECDKTILFKELIADRAPVLNPFDFISISSGIFLENFIYSACSTFDSNKACDQGNITAAWLLSEVRARSLRDSIGLLECDCKINEVGLTSVHVISTDYRSLSNKLGPTNLSMPIATLYN